MSNDRNNQPPAGQTPAEHQQSNVSQNEGLQMNLNDNPRANENVEDSSGNNVVRGDGDGVGSEITDGEAG